MKNLSPLPGFSFVQLDSTQAQLAAKSGLVIPQNLRSPFTRIGTVVAANLTGLDRALIGFDDIQGRRVIVDARHGVIVSEGLLRVNNLVELFRPDGKRYKPRRYESAFAAFIPDEAESVAVVSHDEAKRCMFCGAADASQSRQTVVLVAGRKGLLYCPRCRRTEAGETYDPLEVE